MAYIYYLNNNSGISDCKKLPEIVISIFSNQDRRAELEGLDLAIERQKTSLISMKEGEKILLAEREAARSQLKALRNSNRDKGTRRK